jgi:spermidine/putrescine transport system substrate-binding protein
MIKNNLSSFFIRTVMIGFWLACLGMLFLIPIAGSLWQPGRSITILIWAATIDSKIIAHFKKETGISVNISYIENNEEAYSKVLTTHGEGYDLIMPSDYLVKRFIEHKLIKPIDKTKLTFWDRLNPRLLNHYYDPNNNYSIPYFWEIYGIGINKDYFKKTPSASWDLLFTYPLDDAKIGMLSSPREAILLTAQYLFGGLSPLTPMQQELVTQTLITQKKRVEAYIDADIRSDYLLVSNTCPVTVASSAYIARIMQEYDNFDFLIPKEGGFLLIDSLVIPHASKKDDLVYQFINYLYKPENLRYHFQEYPFLPPTKELQQMMEEEKIKQAIIRAHFDLSLHLEFFKDIINENIANKIWFTLKTM